MNDNIELMMYVYKAADMGVYSTHGLLENLRTKENKIIHVLENELKEYEKYRSISKKTIEQNGESPKGTSMMSKMGSDMGILMETIKDNSDSAIAGMLIEGFTMGVVEMQGRINKFKMSCDKNHLKIAKDLLKFQENEIEKLKLFI